MKKKKTKPTYRLRNWNQYNSSLVNRGSLNIWFSDHMIADWINQQKSGNPGRSNDYSDSAILCMATPQEVYHLPLRQTEELLLSVMKLIRLDLSVPDYSTLCRRRRKLEVCLPRIRRGEPLHVVVDSTGIKVFGEGEWKVRQHGYSRRRTWRKLHLGVDEASGEEEVGYKRRSLGETAMFRKKMVFGCRVSARGFEGQAAQMLVRCAAMNRMTQMGMPDSYAA